MSGVLTPDELADMFLWVKEHPLLAQAFRAERLLNAYVALAEQSNTSAIVDDHLDNIRAILDQAEIPEALWLGDRVQLALNKLASTERELLERVTVMRLQIQDWIDQGVSRPDMQAFLDSEGAR